MSWRERLAALIAAGGLTFTGCDDGFGNCNAFYDPCATVCGFPGPNSQECFNYRHPEAGYIPPDAPVDAPVTDAMTDGEPPDAGTD